MKLIQVSLITAVAMIAFACAPKSPAVQKVEKGLDNIKAGIEANLTDCPKMAAAIQQPASELIMGLKEVKEKNETLPATTKLKFAGLTTTFQKIGPCAKTPEMEQLLTSLIASSGISQ